MDFTGVEYMPHGEKEVSVGGTGLLNKPIYLVLTRQGVKQYKMLCHTVSFLDVFEILQSACQNRIVSPPLRMKQHLLVQPLSGFLWN
jgi:hypothetical protein